VGWRQADVKKLNEMFEYSSTLSFFIYKDE